jgi:DNA-binding MarR family transcriptional regulator
MILDQAVGDSKVREAREEINYGLLPTKVGYRIRKAYSHLFQTFTAMLKELRLAPGQYSVLLLIGLNPGLSQMALAEAVGLDGSTIVPITNRFVKLGWIRRTRRKDDRRFYVLRITAAGQEVLDKARPIIEEHERQLVSALTERECKTLIDLLTRVTEGSKANATKSVRKAGVQRRAQHGKGNGLNLRRARRA